MKDTSPIGLARETAEKLTKQAAEATKLRVQIEQLGFSSDLVHFFKNHQQRCEKLFKMFQNNILEMCNDSNDYSALQKVAKTQFDLFEKRKPLAMAVINGSRPKKEKVKKEKEEEVAKEDDE